LHEQKTLGKDWGLTEDVRVCFNIKGFLDYGLKTKSLIQHFLCVDTLQTQRGQPVMIQKYLVCWTW